MPNTPIRPLLGIFFWIATAGLIGACWPSVAGAREVPPYRGYVNDYADMLSPAAEQRLERLLAAFDRRESTQIAILTIDTLAGDPIEDFSIRTVESWKIGRKGKDNGVLLLVAKKERRIRIEVGYGLEGVLTDLAAGRIIDYLLTPAFRAGLYDEGVERAVGAIIGIVQGQYTAGDLQAGKNAPRQPAKQGGALASYLIVFLFLLAFLGRISRPLGGVAGMIGLPFVLFLAGGASLFLLLAAIPLGLAAGLLLPLVVAGGPGVVLMGPGAGMYHRHHRGGFPGDFGGGGFGGFGGGGFGGGGASGGW